jgi:hypothetical protein
LSFGHSSSEYWNPPEGQFRATGSVNGAPFLLGEAQRIKSEDLHKSGFLELLG